MDNFVVTFARGFGTGGKAIASQLAKELGIHCYENRILTLASQLSGLDENVFQEVNEKLREEGGFTSFLRGLPRAKGYISRNEKFKSDDSYSTRKGKGTLYGIEHVAEHIRLCSENYTKECYILKIDIRSFFMKISKRRLYDLTEELLHERYGGNDLAILLYLLRETIFNRPEKNCIRKTPPQSWRGLPKDKSLFHSDGSCGLPIGNLTSQLLALNFLDGLDHLISEEWGVKHYGRYVDDMVLVHPSKEHLIEVKAKIAGWLSEHGLSLHPRKIYLQHYTKGVLFIGGMILPGRKYLSNRTVGFCYDAIDRLNRLAAGSPDYVKTHGEEFVSTINSYLGMMRHFSSYNLRCKVMSRIGKEWWQVIYFAGHLEKVVLKKRYRQIECKKEEICNEIKELRRTV
jgi:hypothetical protein